jgi:RNA 2',3'-cyclic 3'-phosphodiesterase
MSTRRLFFALWPDESMQKDLAHAARKVVKAAGGKPVPVENFHLTLAFLGSVPESSLEALRAIAERVADACDPQRETFEVTLDRIDYWPKSQIVCATATRRPQAAEDLAQVLKRELVAGGFAPDLKPFRAHVTLVRKVARVTHELDMPNVSWTFRGFSLMESRTDPSGSLYSRKESWALCKRQKP